MSINKQANSRNCFLCGLHNPVGLKMCWFEDQEQQHIRAEVTVPEHFNGYPGVVHGGIVAAILDETSGRSIMLTSHPENLMVTLKLNVTYRRPTPTGTPLTVIGWVEKQGKSRAKVAAEIRLPDGSVTAECQAVIVSPPKEIAEGWKEEKPYWRIYEDE